jgi:hypothetical protein
MMKFVLVDETNGATTSTGEALNPSFLSWAARILDVFLNVCVGAFWGIAGGAFVRAASSISDILDNEWPQHIQPALLDAPGAIAYHTVNGVGVPDLYDGITLSDTLFGPGGWLQAISHEFAETVADPGTNILCADNAGKLFAREVGDPLETQSFPITIHPDGSATFDGTNAGPSADGSFTGYVTNFVTEGYFIPSHMGPYDFMTAKGLPGGTAPIGPFQIVPANGGDYQIWETDPQSEQQVFAAHKAESELFGKVRVTGSLSYRAAKKMHFTSRAHRRGLRFDPSHPMLLGGQGS